MAVVAVTEVRVGPCAVRSWAPTVATGSPVMALHGLASNARLWDGVAHVLAIAGHPVAAVDQRGHGRAERPGDGYDWSTLCADLVAVADRLGWASPVVAGQGWGGNVAVELAARYPKRVMGLVLVDGGTIDLSERFADWPTCEVASTPPSLAGRSWDDVASAIRRSHPDWPESGITGALADLERLDDGGVRARLPWSDHLAILRGLWEHHPSQRWDALGGLPVMIASAGDPSGRHGRSDVAKREEVDRALRHLRAARAVWIDGDHDLHAEHPGTVAALVAEVAGWVGRP